MEGGTGREDKERGGRVRREVKEKGGSGGREEGAERSRKGKI